MTKYILHGGAWQSTVDYRPFFQEMLRDLPNNPTILCTYFARDKGRWKENFLEDQQKFSSLSDTKVTYQMADENTDTFSEQLKNSHLIYIRGGDSHVLQKYLENVSHIETLLKGKTVSGSSAGALVLSEYYYENDDNTYNKGLGILPIKTICHYTEDQHAIVEKLQTFGDPMNNIYKIPEASFFIIKQ